jgi:hypothetical protein
MDRFEKHLDKIIQNVLNEALEERAEEIVAKIQEKTIQSESLKGGQKVLDKNKNNKIDADDFKILRRMKKDVKEYTMGDVEPDNDVEPYGDFSTEKVKIGKVKNSGFKYEKEVGKEFNEGEMMEKNSKEDLDDFVRQVMKGMGWDRGEDRSKVVGVYSNIDKQRMEEEEATEGNAFSGALAKAKKEGKKSFEVDGKKYPVEEGDMTEKKHSKKDVGAFLKYVKDSLGKDNDRDEFDGRPSKVIGVYSNIDKQRMEEGDVNEKWEGDVEVKKTGEYADMSIKQIDAAIKALKDENQRYEDKDKKVPEKNKTKMSQLYFAKRAKKDWPSKGKVKVGESVQLSEDELITLIERLVNEQYMKMQKDTAKVEKENGTINQDHIKATKKKMDQYLETGSEGEYEMDPEGFPVGNGEMKETPKKAYKASDAVEEYIDAFAFPGMTNLVYDEIKPNDEWIEANIKGSSKTGNASVDEDGNALGNVVPSKVGDKFYKNFKDNTYGAEQMNASYKRYPQPVDQAGESTDQGDMRLKKGAKKSQDIFQKLESTEDKSEKLIQEQLDRMKSMVNYNQKTQ